jgi:hypothetical protein
MVKVWWNAGETWSLSTIKSALKTRYIFQIYFHDSHFGKEHAQLVFESALWGDDLDFQQEFGV